VGARRTPSSWFNPGALLGTPTRSPFSRLTLGKCGLVHMDMSSKYAGGGTAFDQTYLAFGTGN
jgi:hypothetical protein